MSDTVRIPLSTGYYVTLPALLDCRVAVLAHAAKMDVAQFLDEIERWSETMGFIYGVQVDREAETVTQPRANQYPENPHLSSTTSAAWWDVSRSLRLLVGMVRDAFLDGFRRR